MPFATKIEQTARNKRSNIVLALDFPFEKTENYRRLFLKADRTLETVSPHICAVKFNRHLILPLGLFDGVKKLVEKTHDMGLVAIMDCKVNDIGASNQTIAQYYYSAGFDAVIANPLVGWEEGLQPVFDVAQKLQRGVILLVYMSHKGSWEGYGQMVYDAKTEEKLSQYVSFAKKAIEWGADGVVVGATYPKKIREVHEILNKKIPIFSPGIGAQGGEIKSALNAGSSYLIVGRAITLSKNPEETTRNIKEQVNNYI